MSAYPRIASLKTAAQFRAHLAASRIAIEFDEALAPPQQSPMAQPIEAGGIRAGNRFCILPMEGWDGTNDGKPSELTRRRWRNFGISGAKFIWGGEAVAVRHDGRANPNQLMLTAETQSTIASMRDELVQAHRELFGSNADRDLAVGLQLTHSGRYARPNVYDRPEPIAGWNHPALDRRFPAGIRVLTDDELETLVDDFVAAARRARDAGFGFVDVKACHGYLGHEMLGAVGRPGRFGGSLENRTRFLRAIIDGIRSEVPGLAIVVRLSVVDTVPYRKGAAGIGTAESGDGAYGFGLLNGDDDIHHALTEAREVVAMLAQRGIRWICTTAGSPYYNPHVQRPAIFPPVDGYEPPEDPLRGVARQIEATAQLKRSCPGTIFVGSAYSYLQEWLPNVAQHAVREGLTDLVGLGRIVLAYPDLPADILGGAPLKRARFCRTFSDCTTGPRMGLVSGCYPLDDFYAKRPEAARVLDVRTRRSHDA